MNDPILKILLIEDNLADAELIRQMVLPFEENHAIKTSDRLSTGLKTLSAESFDIVLLDLGLPDSSGIETLQKFQKKVPELPVIVLTGLADEDLAIQAIGLGAQDYLVKGRTDRALLIRAIRYAIERKKSEEIFKLFIKHTPAAVAMFDTNMRYILASPRWLNDYGLVGQDIIGRSHYEIFPEIPDRWKEIHQRCLAGAIEKCEEDPFPRLDGRTDWVRWEVRPWYQSNNEIGGIVMFTEVITERKAAEEKILKERDFSRAALDSLPGIVYLFDLEGRFLRWNRNFEQVSEYSPEEISRMNPLDFFIGSDKRLIHDRILEAFEKGSADAEAEFITKSGKHKPFYYTGRIIQVEGKPCLVGMGIDITERKRIDEELRKSEEHFRRLTEQSPVPIAISNERGEIEYVNEQFVRTFGYTRDDIPNIDAWFVRAYPDPGYRREVIAVWDRAVKTAIQRQSVIAPHEYRVSCKDGTIRTVEIFGSTIGRREQVIFNDVTGRKRAEETVKESRERFKNLVEASSDWVWEVDEHGVYTYASPKVRDILGYEPEEVLGKTPFDFMPPEEAERVAAIFKEIAASQKPFSLLENINLHKNGKPGGPRNERCPFLRRHRNFERIPGNRPRHHRAEARRRDDQVPGLSRPVDRAAEPGAVR